MKNIFNTSISLVFCIALLSVAPAYAEDIITWEQCVKSALVNNPSLNAKRKSVEQSEYQYKDAYNNFFPKISLSHGYSLSGPQFDGGGRGSWSAGVSASETLWGLSNNSSFRTSKISYEQAKIVYDIESASLRKTLYSNFMSLLVAQEQVTVSEKILKIREENANLIKLKYESGRESRGNMKYASALYRKALVSKQASIRSLEAAQRDLLTAMGQDSYRTIKAQAELKIPDKTFTDTQLQTALENAPQIKSQRLTLQKSKETVTLAKSSLYPTLSASQSLSWSGDSEFPNDSKRWGIGFSLSIPLFSGGLTHYYNNTKAAKAGLEAAEENYRNTKLSLEYNLRSAHFSLLNACETVEAGEAVLDAAEERYKEAQINYMSGNLSFINFETIEQDLVDAQQNQLQYLKNANEQRINLESLMGVTLEK